MSWASTAAACCATPRARWPATLVTRVRAPSLRVRPVAGRFEPAVGAIFLALEAAGLPVDEPLLARLMSTLPPDTLLAP